MLIFTREGKKRIGRRGQDHDGMRKEFGWPALRSFGEGGVPGEGGRIGLDHGGGSFNGGGIPCPASNPYILYPFSMLYDSIVASMLYSANFDHFGRNEPK